MHLLSVNVGLPQDVEWRGQTVRTSIFKRPAAGPVAVLAEHLAGDGQADLRVHGGPDKAVYAYPHEHYAYWQQHLPAELLVPGAFGENLTTSGLLESDVPVGALYRVGTAVLMAVQPRRPCAKLGIRLNDPGMVRRFEEARRSGVYFRIIQEGIIQAGDALMRLEPGVPEEITIQDMVDSNALPDKDFTKIEAMLQLPDLSPSWRARLEQMLAASGR
ncbi:MOSC domain-containing protein [Hymenobacter nivis]|uniref:MOSC domain-containing protein n=1 Tax=Hymenobacter nivis TaxID=1850093 RepID=A0A502GZQ3_9BACT|nr:MOSC domain-containing protein [Hymenobacter nivis]TPG66620.1 MOSC domain-containing protein [Hymenobacter nivis]